MFWEAPHYLLTTLTASLNSWCKWPFTCHTAKVYFGGLFIVDNNSFVFSFFSLIKEDISIHVSMRWFSHFNTKMSLYLCVPALAHLGSFINE